MHSDFRITYVHCTSLTFHLFLCCIDPINLLLNRIHNSVRFIDSNLGTFVDSVAAFKIICKTNINKNFCNLGIFDVLHTQNIAQFDAI